MALYVKVFNNFYSHRKTLRLRAIIGDDALWVPPRLWAYAAENVPSGSFDGFDPGEIAALIGYNKDASSMLQALVKVGFLDSNPLRIHDWDEHNAYHKTYADRAKAAAETRWKKNRDENDTDIDRSKHTTSMLQASRKHGIPSVVEDVIAYGATLNPKVDEQSCRDFFAHYEGQAKTGPNGDIFWITGSDTVITNWKAKLPQFSASKLSTVRNGKAFAHSLAQQITATQKLLTEATEKVRRKPRPNRSLLTDDEYAAEMKVINALIEDKAKLAERLKELNQQQSEGGRQ